MYNPKFDDPINPPKKVAICFGVTRHNQNIWSFWEFPRDIQDQYWQLNNDGERWNWLQENGRKMQAPVIYVSSIIGNPISFSKNSLDNIEVRRI